MDKKRLGDEIEISGELVVRSFLRDNLVEIWRGSRESWRRERQKRERERERDLPTGPDTMKNSNARCDGMAELVPQTERAGGGGWWTMEVATCSNDPAAFWPLLVGRTGAILASTQ